MFKRRTTWYLMESDPFDTSWRRTVCYIQKIGLLMTSKRSIRWYVNVNEIDQIETTQKSCKQYLKKTDTFETLQKRTTCCLNKTDPPETMQRCATMYLKQTSPFERSQKCPVSPLTMLQRRTCQNLNETNHLDTLQRRCNFT